MTVSFERPTPFHYADVDGKTDMSDRAIAIFFALELACVIAFYAIVAG
jgi:hypothetical protein